MNAPLNLTGHKYGFLTVLREDTSAAGVKKWICRCDCSVEKSVAVTKLRSGSTKSCGCMRGKIETSLEHSGAHFKPIEQIVGTLLASGYEYIEGVVNKKTSGVKIKCLGCGAVKTIRFDFATSRRCQKCYFNESRKDLWSKIEQRTSDLGYVLRTFESEFIEACSTAKRAEQVLFSVVCDQGHGFKTRWSCYKQNKCQKCSVTARNTEDSLRRKLLKKGWHFVSVVGEYKNKHSKITCECAQGHLVTKSHRMMMQAGCLECQKENLVVRFEETAALIEAENYKIVKAPEWPYDVLTPFILKCPKGHEFTTTRHGWVSDGSRCSVCALCVNESKGERELKEYIGGLGVSVTKYRVGSFEIDIFLPDYKIGVEFNGIYWHSTARQKNENVHKLKYEMAKKQGIKLLQLWEDEWELRKSAVISLITSKIPGQHTKYHARSCDVVDLSFNEAKDFLDKYHLQGAGGNNFKKAVGLKDKDNLLMVAVVGSHQRQGHEDQNVLTRVCYAPGIRIVAGMERLMHYLPRPLITWSDNRYSDGNLYKACGFRKDKELPPDYSYVKGGKRFSKQSLRKTEEERLGEKTEKQLREEQGYHRLYDAGKVRWVLD
jgi:hypothetical protein